MKLPCYFYGMYGFVIGSTPSEPYTEPNSLKSRVFAHGYTSKALVLLETFSKGQVAELPWYDVHIVETIETAKEMTRII